MANQEPGAPERQPTSDNRAEMFDSAGEADFSNTTPRRRRRGAAPSTAPQSPDASDQSPGEQSPEDADGDTSDSSAPQTPPRSTGRAPEADELATEEQTRTPRPPRRQRPAPRSETGASGENDATQTRSAPGSRRARTERRVPPPVPPPAEGPPTVESELYTPPQARAPRPGLPTEPLEEETARKTPTPERPAAGAEAPEEPETVGGMTIEEAIIRFKDDFGLIEDSSGKLAPAPKERGGSGESIAWTYMVSREAYKQALQAHKEVAEKKGKSVKLGRKEALLRDKYLSDRNQVLRVITNLQRAGAGYNRTDSEKARGMTDRGLTQKQIIDTFVRADQKELGGLDSSFNTYEGIARDADLLETIGPSLAQEAMEKGGVTGKIFEALTFSPADKLNELLQSDGVWALHFQNYASARTKLYPLYASNRSSEGILLKDDTRGRGLSPKKLRKNAANFRTDTDPIWSHNKNRVGIYTQYEKAVRGMLKVAEKFKGDPAVKQEVRKLRKELACEHNKLRNQILKQQMPENRRGMVAPVAESAKRGGFWSGLFNSVFKRNKNQEAGE